MREDHERLTRSEALYMLRSQLSVLIVIVATYGVYYGLNLVLAHTLSPSHYGDVILLFHILILTVPFVLLGAGFSAMYYIPVYLQEQEYHKLKGYTWWAKRRFLWAASAWIAVGTIFVSVVIIADRIGFYQIANIHPVLFAFWLIPLYAYTVLQSYIIRSLQQTVISQLRLTAYFLLIILFTTLLLLVHNVVVQDMLWIIGIALVIVITVQQIIINLVIPAHVKQSQANVKLRKRWSASSLDMMLNAVIVISLSSVMFVLLEIYGASEDHLGEYAAITSIVGILPTFNQAAKTVFNPLISRVCYREEWVKLQDIVKLINLFKLIPGLILALFIILFGKTFLRLFGVAYVIAYVPLIIITINYVLHMYVSSTASLLIFSGSSMSFSKIGGTQLLLVIILGSILIPLFHLYGAVCTLLIGNLVGGILGTLALRRKIGIRLLYFI